MGLGGKREGSSSCSGLGVAGEGLGSPNLTLVPLSLSLRTELHCSFGCYQVLRGRSLNSKRTGAYQTLGGIRGWDHSPVKSGNTFSLVSSVFFMRSYEDFNRLGIPL